MKRVKRLMVIIVVTLLMVTGCSNGTTPNEINNTDFPQSESEDKMPDQTDSNEENTDSDANVQAIGESIYGRVKSIIGNEVEIELGNVPDWDGGNGDKDEDKEKPGVPMIKVKEKENPPGVEEFYAPDPSNPLYGEDGEINLVYTGEKYSLQGTTQGNGLTGGVPPVRFSM